jgi:hypothetical protein
MTSTTIAAAALTFCFYACFWFLQLCFQPWLISILAVVVVGDISEFALMSYNM